MHGGDGRARRPRWFNARRSEKLGAEASGTGRGVAADGCGTTRRDRAPEGRAGGRPNIRPSGVAQATEAKPAGNHERAPRRGHGADLLTDEERTVKGAAPAPQPRRNGSTSCPVAHLLLRAHVVT